MPSPSAEFERRLSAKEELLGVYRCLMMAIYCFKSIGYCGLRKKYMRPGPYEPSPMVLGRTSCLLRVDMLLRTPFGEPVFNQRHDEFGEKRNDHHKQDRGIHSSSIECSFCD